MWFCVSYPTSILIKNKPNTFVPTNTNAMKTIFHPAEQRGKSDFGWLKAQYSFSFSNYHNPERMNFGTLRVLNDDHIEGGMGFSKHPHQNMEIITIPLQGALKHEDSMGNAGVISKGDIQVMSAGSGVMHSEKNANSQEAVQLLQIWMFPNQLNVSPRYEQKSIKTSSSDHSLEQIVSPNADDDGVWIHQDAWFYWGNFSVGNTVPYPIKKEGNGVYIFVIKGEIKINKEKLNPRDALGIWDTTEFLIEVLGDSEFLIMDIPMNIPTFAN